MLAAIAPENMDVGLVLMCSALVFLMQAGFCMLESGMIRAKNSINVAVKNLLDFSISMLVFAAFGFSMMFGASHMGLIGSHVDFWADNELGAFFIYQMVFCGTAATIVSGAIAERTKLSTYAFIVLLVSGLTYPLVGHWCWGGALGETGIGWISNLGFVDWAGATVVHVVGGFTALAATLAIGPRRHYRTGGLNRGHSLTLAILGCFLLWFGWWGFNGGSSLSAGNNMSRVLLNTNMGAVAGLLAATVRSIVKNGKTDVVDVISGALAGLVSVTGACHAVSPIAAVAAGAIGSMIALVVNDQMNKRKVDDAIGAFGIHGAAGLWGTVVFAVFAPEANLNAATRFDQLSIQMLGTVVAAAFAFGTTYLSLRLLARFTRLRVKAYEEKTGLNVVEHGAINEVTALLGSMHQHRSTGDFSIQLEIDTDTEVGQIAHQYNAVIQRVSDEVQGHERTNQSLQSEKLRLKSVLENAGVGIYQLDQNGHFQSANTTLLETFGYRSIRELDNQDAPYHIPWHVNNPDTLEMLLQCFRMGQPVGDLETQCIDENGDARWLLESIVPVRDEHGRLVTWLGTVHEVTERKQAMIAKVEIAEAKSKAKGEFLANMSHEIRTPLNGVIGMIDLLSNSKLDGREENYVGVAGSSAEMLLSLINDVLDFSKIEAGKLELEAVDFDLRDLMESTANQFATRAQIQGLEMNCELASDLPFRVNGDPERLRQVIVNLMGNAIKFTETGEINLRVSRRGDVIRFGVQDTGIGISNQAQSTLFESFVQADVSTTRRYGGTGLGLSIANQLVEKMGGRLNVDSEIGKGSEFWFEMAMPIADQAQPQNRESDVPKSGLSNLDALIDDDGSPPQSEPISTTPIATPPISTPPISNDSILDSSTDLTIALSNPLSNPSATDAKDHESRGFSVDVLIAEDNQVNQFVVQQMLGKLGYSCEVVGDGQQALDRVQSGNYAMILMDGHMPVMDGLTATKEIRSWEQAEQVGGVSVNRTPIIALTANVVSGIRTECLDAGMDDYLCKPITLERLKETVQTYVKPTPVAAPAMTTDSPPVSLPSQVAPSAEPVDPAWFDQASLLDRCGGDVAFQERLLSVMRDTLPTRVSDLREAGSQHNWTKVKQVAHQLRGAAGDTSLIAVHEAAGDLEAKADQGNTQAIEGALAELEARVETTLQFLQRTLR